MNSSTAHYIPFFSDGYVEADLTSEIVEQFKNEAIKIELNNFCDTIPSNSLLPIKHSMIPLAPSIELENFIKRLVSLYVNNATTLDLNYSDSKITSLWINFQKKYEFSPLHNHEGELSFVTWLNLAYNVENEKKLFDLNLNNFPFQPTKTNFWFIIPQGDNINLHEYPQPNSNTNPVGKIILFNSKCSHLVYPFYTSDEYRISVAGNIKLTYDSHNEKTKYS